MHQQLKLFVHQARKVKRVYKRNLSQLILNLAFKKMAPLCELQAKHGVELETGYKNNQAYLMFIEYTANEQRILLNDKLNNVKYFSIQVDRSTDCANKGLFLALF